MFAPLYTRVVGWSRHRRAPWYLGALSFAESSFFPVPPDVMLAPMAMTRPERAWFYALITTVMSVAGGVAGYLVGMLLFETISPWLHRAGHWDAYLQARAWFDEWGFWAIFLAGFSPIPYKVFTIAAGTIGMALMPFVIASAIGRGARFFLVAALMRWGGERMESMLRVHVERLGWAAVVLLVALYLVIR